MSLKIHDPMPLSTLTAIEHLLTDEERMIRDSVKRFIRERFLPRAGKLFEEEKFPTDLIPEMAQMGLLGASLQGYGCAGMGAVAYGLALQELEYGDGGMRSFASVQGSLCMYPIYRFGSDAQKDRWLPKMAKGEIIGCFGLTEPDSGSDPGSMKTYARRENGRWVLNGTKMWITNAPHADTLVVYAKTDATAGPRGITAFLIEKGFKGFTVAQKLDKLGMRGSDTAELVFQDCEVPEEAVMGREGGGVNVLMSGLDYERAVLAAGSIGIMQSCMDVVLPYIHERKQFGAAIGSFQLMQGKIADMYVTLSAARAYVYNVARACDRGQTTRKDAAGAILYAAENATKMALDAIQCLGGNGYINDYPTGRLLRDAKLYEIGAGTSEIRRWLIGRELFEETG
jgi:isovaleryl-CoA dehydrogenase